MKRMMERSAAGDFRWALTLFPTNAYASEAGMSLSDYEDFYYGSCLADRDDPVAAWKVESAETERLGLDRGPLGGPHHGRRDRPEARDRGPHLHPGRRRHNMPDGEFFTGPVEDSAEGEITFHLPASYAGREVAGVRFRFEGGKVVDASASRARSS